MQKVLGRTGRQFLQGIPREMEISGKIQTKENKNSTDLENYLIQPYNVATEGRKMGRVSFTVG